MRRPEGVTMIAIWHFLVVFVFLLGLIGMSIGTLGIWADGSDFGDIISGTLAMGIAVLAMVFLATAFGVVGWGLWTMKEWSRSAAMFLAILQLIVIPFGTAAGIATLVYMNRNQGAKDAFGIGSPGSGSPA